MPRRKDGMGVRHLVTQLADQIHRGDLPPGAPLPSERTFAATWGVHRSTAALVYAELQADGLVERRQGSGTTVRGDLWGVAPDWPRYLADGAFRPVEGLVRRLREARRSPDVIDLSEGSVDPTLLPTGMVARLLHCLDPLPDLGYPDPLGEPGLRDTVAADFGRRHGGAAPDPSTVLVTAGAQQALYLVARALLRPGDAIAIERPSYAYSLPFFQTAGIRLLPLPVDDRGVDPEALRPLAERFRLRLVVVNPTLHNPTSTTLPLARRERLLAVCRLLNLPVVEDAAYEQLAFGPIPPPLKALDTDGRVLHVGTLSKAAAPGLRIGWVLGPAPVVARLADVKGQIDFGTDVIGQRLASDLLRSTAWEEHLRVLRTALRSRRDALTTELDRALGPAFSFRLPTGGLYLWGRWAREDDDRRRLEAGIRAGVAAAPGRLYGAADGFVRLSYGRADEAGLAVAVSRLREAECQAAGGTA